WICVAVGVARLPHAVYQVVSLVAAIQTRRISSYDLWHGKSAMYLWLDNIVQNALLPPLLVAGAVACLRLKRWGPPALLTYAGASVGVGFATILMREMDTRIDVWWRAGLLTIPLVSAAYVATLPAVLWVLLRRPEIRSVFAPPVRGFRVDTEPPD